MKPDKLSDAIGLVDELLIEEADRGRRVVRRGRRWWVQWVAIAACLCLIAAGVFSLPRLTPQDASDPSDPSVSTSSTPQTTTTTGKNPVVSKAMVVSEAKYSTSHWDVWLEFLEGNYADGLYDFYEPVIKQMLVGRDGQNRVFSPLNVYMALATLAEATDGNGRQQILDLLGVKDMATLRKKANILWEVNYEETEHSASLLANSVWMSNELEYNNVSLDILADTYYASVFSGEMGNAEYDKMLQNWINRQTGGILEEQVAGVRMNPSSVLNLVSTVHFGAKWIDEFDPEMTAEGVFHAADGDVTCDFMHGTEDLEFVSHGDGFMATSRPLGSSYQMVLVLPDEGASIGEVIQNEGLYAVLSGTEHPAVETDRWLVTLTMPKFDVEHEVDLVGGLQALGVTDVFDSEAADFSRILYNADGVSVSSIQHAARVTVDEQGCTAAAFTRSDLGYGDPEHNGPLAFTLDRPFLFFITNRSQGAVLFAGVVEQP